MADNASNRRQKAAAARSVAEAGEKRRERTVRIVGAVVVLVVVVAIIAIAVFAKNAGSSSSDGTQPDAGAAIPATVLPAGDDHEFGVPVGTAGAGVPVLQIWEDFQCPACAAVEKANGSTIEQLAKEGKVQLIWRPTTFLDKNLNNDSSERAVAAWGCAIDGGKAVEFHNVVYANQPANEGDGFTDAALLGFGEQAGLSGDALTAFQKCVTDGTYRTWGANSTNSFYQAGIPGTPTALLNGKEITTDVLADPAKLAQAIADASKSN